MNDNFTLSGEELYVLVNVYNSLLGIKTQGEDSFLYTDAMRGFKKVIQSIQQNKKEE